VEPLLSSGALEPHSHRDLAARLYTAPETTQSLADLLAAYRAVVIDIESGLKRPVRAQRARSVTRALAFVKDHLSEPLTLTAVAKVAGFAPTYFSKIWKHDQGTTFERSLLAFRLERAKRALSTTELSVGRVAALTGFRCRTHFQQAFKRSVRMTPIQYRRATKIEGPATEERHASRVVDSGRHSA
jgi:transcriptional regulator GlxA family with amidase domain